MEEVKYESESESGEENERIFKEMADLNRNKAFSKMKTKHDKPEEVKGGAIQDAGDHFLKGEFQIAREICSDIITKYPEIPDAYDLIIKCCEEMDDMVKKDYYETLKLGLVKEKNPDIWLDKGKIAEEKQLYEEAYIYYKRAAALSKNSRPIYKKYAEFCKKVPKYGIAKYTQIMTEHVLSPNVLPMYERDLLAIAQNYKKQKKIKEAVDLLKRGYSDLKSESIALSLLNILKEMGVQESEKICEFYEGNINILRGGGYAVDFECIYVMAKLKCEGEAYYDYNGLIKLIGSGQIMVCKDIAHILLDNNSPQVAILFFEHCARLLKEINETLDMLYPGMIYAYQRINNYNSAYEHASEWIKHPTDSTQKYKKYLLQTELADIYSPIMEESKTNSTKTPSQPATDNLGFSQTSINYVSLPIKRPVESITLQKLDPHEGFKRIKLTEDDSLSEINYENLFEFGDCLCIWNKLKIIGGVDKRICQRLACATIVELTNNMNLGTKENELRRWENDVDLILLLILVAILDDFTRRGYLQNGYTIMHEIESITYPTQELSGTRINKMPKEDEKRDIIEYIKLIYLQISYLLIEKDPTKAYEYKDKALQIASELYEYYMETKLSIQPYFDLLNSFWEGSNKYFNSKNLKKIGEKSKENPAKNFAANLLLAKHSFQAETFEKCISKYKELLNIIENCEEDQRLVNIEMLYLCMGVCYIQQSMSRTKSRTEKDEDILNAFREFKKYYKIREISHPAEANYNLARAYHQVSFFSQAIEYYEIVLKIHTVKADKNKTNVHDYYEESVYNLAMAYKKLDVQATKIREKQIFGK